MNHQGQEAVDEYRSLAKQADSLRAKLEAAKARIRGLLERVSELEGGARKAKRRYQLVLPKHVAGNMAEEIARGAKQDLGSAEGDLAEAKGVLQALQTELPRLTGEKPPDGPPGKPSCWICRPRCPKRCRTSWPGSTWHCWPHGPMPRIRLRWLRSAPTRHASRIASAPPSNSPRSMESRLSASIRKYGDVFMRGDSRTTAHSALSPEGIKSSANL